MRKRTVKILKGTAITVVVLGVTYAVAVAVSSAKLRRAYANLEKSGRPMNPANIIPAAVPDAENAALLYESAILLLKAQPAEQDNLLNYLGGLSGTFLTEPLDADKRTELERLLETDVVDNALSIIKQGTQRRLCRFDHNYTDGINMLLPNLSEMRKLTRILAAKACVEAEAGRPDASWNLIQTQLRFADALRNEPILVSQLVRFAMIRTSCETIQKICEVAPPNAEQYRCIESLLSDYEDRTPLVLALDGERLLLGEWAFHALRNGSVKEVTAGTGDESDFGEVLMRLYAAFKPLLLADQAAYVRVMGEFTRSAQQSYSPIEANTMDRKVEQMQSRLHVVTNMLVPPIIRVKILYGELIARIHITRAGLAVLQDKKSRDALPQTLESLNLKDVSDPFSGGPLLYRANSNGFILYSVGPDQKDNNGSPKEKKDKKETDWDIVWSYAGGR